MTNLDPTDTSVNDKFQNIDILKALVVKQMEQKEENFHYLYE